MPPPTTSSRFGMSCSISASVESITRGSSHGKPGSFTGCEPAAMMQFAKRMRFVPSAVTTSSTFAEANLPVPVTVRTLRAFAMPARPPVSWPTTLSLCARSLSRSILASPNDTPYALACFASSITSAACSKAFEGMQPTLRHTPPSCG